MPVLADQLTLFQSGGTDYADLVTTSTPRFSDLPTALMATLETLSQDKEVLTRPPLDLLALGYIKNNDRHDYMISQVIYSY